MDKKNILLWWIIIYVPFILGIFYVVAGIIHAIIAPDYNPQCWRAPFKALENQPEKPAPFDIELANGNPPIVCVKAYNDDIKDRNQFKVLWVRCYKMENICP